MRTILGGVRSLRRAPLAMLPLTLEALVAAVLVGVGAFPRNGASAISTAVFPLDVFFDLKQGVTFAASWPVLVATVAMTLLVRSLVLGLTLWLADNAPGRFAIAWARALRLTAIATVAMLPIAVLYFAGVALRYAPFIWIAAPAGLILSLLFARRAARLDVGGGEPAGKGVPEGSAYYGYGVMLTAVAAAMTVLGEYGAAFPALMVAFLGPLHALYLLGWREHLSKETYPGGGVLVTAATALAVMVLAGNVVYDRYIRDAPPTSRAAAPGSLLILGGADSTSKTGALADLDSRDLGFAPTDAQILSYAPTGQAYGATDTHRDLGDLAKRISVQIASASAPRNLVGHSQAALIVDRILRARLTPPDRTISISPPPPEPPGLAAGLPADAGELPAGTLADGLSALFERLGADGFDVGAPSAPLRLRSVVVADTSVPRLAVWAIGDSVWLDRDWRRPGEINVVALTDHVGATNNGRTIDAARAFLTGNKVDRDEHSWRGFLASVARYAFEPWRPR
ncbi:MAG: hypothetical protein M3345_07015 [Actinomycetota bacterium]|nr:hypothetical protein [Actinomycetota bacterium]